MENYQSFWNNNNTINSWNIWTAIVIIWSLINRYCEDLYNKCDWSWEYKFLPSVVSEQWCAAQYNPWRSFSVNINEIDKLREKWIITHDVNITMMIAHEFWHHLSEQLWLRLSNSKEEQFADEFAWYVLKMMCDDYWSGNDITFTMDFFKKLWDSDEELKWIMNYHWNGQDRIERIFNWFCWWFEDDIIKIKFQVKSIVSN